MKLTNTAKSLVISLLTLSSIALLSSTTTKEPSEVYICTGKSSKVYHYNKNCKGLNNCKADVKTISLDKAKKIKRGCKICVK